MINLIVSECRKLSQNEYKTRHNWVEKVIHWELHKRVNFDDTTKTLENAMHKIFWNFEIS